ncbi:metal-dependent hydrolase [Mycobacterium sp. 94-17]|uniref:metal-dependent hydrolase n=1 Tax=Mycobacterium sp. 94-17 TaxID=2986147 RepID=UPI002D1F1B84|nr:metal-dependent hydrolase [Mycobacterium sp. 94-17]MEB4208041.1 metal-dependent hydrolase [Mycobacterium sp. 94-17]
MTKLVIRKIPWEFDETIPFLWQPAHPNFSMFCDVFTFIAVPFEKYIIAALRQAQDRLAEDAGVAAEAEAFLRQEAQHAAAHRKHMKALIAKYPGLEQCHADATSTYERLIAQHPVEFHAAYVANLEATFTPLFKVILDNRETLFGGGDPRVASLMAWHFVEEIEHRSSGLILNNHINRDPWYRVKLMRQTFKHVGEMTDAIAKRIDEVVPFEDRRVSATELLSGGLVSRELKARFSFGRRQRRDSNLPTLFDNIPAKDLAKMAWRLMLSQTPGHDPADQPLPAWADVWMRSYDEGTDMRTFFGSAASTGDASATDGAR